MNVYYGSFGRYVGLLLFIAKITKLITVVLALVILGYLQLGQDNKSRKSFLMGKCNGRQILNIVLACIS